MMRLLNEQHVVRIIIIVFIVDDADDNDDDDEGDGRGGVWVENAVGRSWGSEVEMMGGYEQRRRNPVEVFIL